MSEDKKPASAPEEILVVEDTPASLRLLSELLTQHGYRVRPASDGALALKSVAARTPDLILLDVNMPGMDGYEVCRRLKADEKTSRIPVIFISAFGDTRQKVTGFEAGGLDYITKPFEAEEVLARVQTHLRLRQAEEALRQAHNTLELRVQERTAQLQATIAELEQMSYSMIHDLRGPLRAIQSFGGIVAEDPENRLTEESQGLIAKMRLAADRMDHLVRDMLNYGRVVRKELPLSPVDVGALARGIVETYPNLYGSAVQVQIAGAFPPVLGNAAALTQCLSQVLRNAVKFRKPGQPPQIRVWGEKGANGWVRIVVADQGIGFAPHLRDKVFGLFQQLRNTTEGTGMGLAIVKKAVEHMGGRVGVESEPGHGSQFWLELKGVGSADAFAGARCPGHPA